MATQETFREASLLPDSDMRSVSRRALPAGETGPWLAWSRAVVLPDSAGVKGFTDFGDSSHSEAGFAGLRASLGIFVCISLRRTNKRKKGLT